MKTARSVAAEMDVMDIANRATTEAYYVKTGPYIMSIEVNGQLQYISQTTPRGCVKRADDQYENWTEIKLRTQTDFMRDTNERS